LQYGDKDKEYNYELSDIPNPLYFPGGAAVAALDVDTGVDIGGKLTAIGFSKDNIDFTRGKIRIKVIQADSERRNKRVQTVMYDLTFPFTDEIGMFGRILKSIFGSKKKKKEVKPHHAAHVPHDTIHPAHHH
jgi:hypothetical protein